MSDDFDKLPPINEDDEDDLPDWQRDPSRKKPGEPTSGDSLGFTGELSWRKELDDAFEDALDDVGDDFDWQTDQPDTGSPASPGGFGFTRELDWKQTDAGKLEEPEPGEAMDWLSGVVAGTPPPPEEEDPFALPPEEPAPTGQSDDPLSWLEEFSAEDESQAVEPAPQAEVPSWLDDAEPPADAPPAEDVPDWLMAFDEAKPSMTESGKLSEDWLAGAEQAPETTSADMTFDQWQQMQDSLTRPRDLEDEMPDLFSELGGETVSPDDLPASDTGALPSWVLGMEELDESRAPDWFSDAPDPTAPSSPTEPVPDDIFAELGLSSPETGYDFLDMPAEDDLLAGLNLGDQGEQPDWFANADHPAAKDVPDWLQDLGDIGESASEPPKGEAVPADEDFMATLRDLAGDDDSQPAAAEIDPFDTSGLQDIDSLLASYEVSAPLPAANLSASAADFDSLLSDEELDALSARRTSDARPGGIEGLSPDAPDWLSELGASVDEISAAAIVRKQAQRERPLDELPDRLQALHERGLELPPTSEDTAPNDVIKTLLPGVDEVLPSAPIKTIQPERVGDLVLTDAQKSKINLLRTMVGAEQDQRRTARPSAIDLTLSTPNFDDLDSAEPDLALDAAEAEPIPVSRVRPRRRVKIDRLVISLVLLVAVGLPFIFPPARIGDLPPAQFLAGSPQEAVYQAVENLRANDLALVAAEYGPTGAGELDTALDAVLRHILKRGGRPVIVSGNAVGLLHARNVLERIVNDPAFLAEIEQPALQANEDYYVARYLAANTIGLRAFSEDPASALAVDASGQATRLPIETLRNFPFIMVISESAEDLRAWAEQVAPLAGKPLFGAVSQSAAPLSEPYVLRGSPTALSGLSGLLVGYRDAYTYRNMVDGNVSPPPILQPTETTPPPTATPLAPVIEATEETTAEAGTEATGTPDTDETDIAATATTPPTATSQPTSTTTPTATLTPTATTTPTTTPTPTRTPNPGVTVRAVVNSTQAINVREGPGRNFTPIAGLTPGTIVTVIGRSGDGEWIQVELDDGREGWVSADLLAIEEPATEEATPTAESLRRLDGIMLVGLMSDVSVFPALQVETTPEATVEAAEEAAEEAPPATTAPTAATPEAPIANAAFTPTVYRDERWYGMTLGLVAIILIITVGMIANILRGLFRRNKS
jgi:hypothetical protein